MGVCCASNHTDEDTLLDEMKKDSKITDFESKENEDFLWKITHYQTKEKIVYEIQDNPLENYSKLVFQKLNQIRTKPREYQEESRKYQLEDIIYRIINSEKKPTLLSWSTAKSRIVTNLFTSKKSSHLANQQKSELMQKFGNDFTIYEYTSKGNLSEPGKCVWNLLRTLSQKDINDLLFEHFEYCVIYSEKINNITDRDFDNNIVSYFFLFQFINY